MMEMCVRFGVILIGPVCAGPRGCLGFPVSTKSRQREVGRRRTEGPQGLLGIPAVAAFAADSKQERKPSSNIGQGPPRPPLRGVSALADVLARE